MTGSGHVGVAGGEQIRVTNNAMVTMTGNGQVDNRSVINNAKVGMTGSCDR